MLEKYYDAIKYIFTATAIIVAIWATKNPWWILAFFIINSEML